MLRGYMKESKEDSVDLGDISAVALQMVVDFIYSGEMDLDMDSLIDMLNAANRLQIQTALDLCSDYMISLLTFANAEELMHIADMYLLSRVTDFYKAKVLNEFDAFSRCAVFFSLSAKQLESYLADDQLKIKSEHQLLDTVVRWCSHDAANRTDSVPALIKCIRFGLLSKHQLLQLQQMQHSLKTQCPAVLNAIEAGLKYHTDSAAGHPRISSVCQIRAHEKSLVLVHQGSSLRPFEIMAYDHVQSKFYTLASDTNGSRDCRVTVIDNFVYISRVVDSGGGALVNGLVRFDPRHLVLQTLTPCRRLRIDPAIAACGRQLYKFGGSVDVPQGACGNTVLDSVECYDAVSNVWTERQPLPQPLHSHAAVYTKGRVFISGGITTPGRLVPDMLSYDLATDQYTLKAPMFSPRRLHEMAAIDDSIYILGGIGAHSFHQNTLIPIESYSIDTNQWTLLSQTLAGRSIGHFVAFQDGILSLGREHHQATEDDIWRYDTKCETWTTFTKAPLRTSLSSTFCALLHVNFFDEKIAWRAVQERR